MAAEKGKTGLSALALDEFSSVMSERLHGHQSLGPAIDAHGDTPAYLWLVDEHDLGSERLRSWMDGVAERFVNELPDMDKWPDRARANLLDLAQACGLAHSAVRRLIRTEALLQHPAGGPDVHAGLLKCSLGQGNRRSVSFWLEQLELLGDDYGALIFGGLLEHGLDAAAAHLSKCCVSEEAAIHMSLVIPALVDRHGLRKVVQALDGPMAQLGDAARAELAEALEVEGWKPVSESAHAVNKKTWARPKAAPIADDLVVRRAA